MIFFILLFVDRLAEHLTTDAEVIALLCDILEELVVGKGLLFGLRVVGWWPGVVVIVGIAHFLGLKE